MIWEEMDYNKPKLTMTQRLSYEREPELFDIDGSDNYNDSAITELDRNYDKKNRVKLLMREILK